MEVEKQIKQVEIIVAASRSGHFRNIIYVWRRIL